MMFGVLYRLVRIVCNEDFVYKSRDGKKEWVIEWGIFIGMILMINYWDEEFFFDFDEYILERWFVDGQFNYKLVKFLIVFGRGSCLCVGEQ